MIHKWDPALKQMSGHCILHTLVRVSKGDFLMPKIKGSLLIATPLFMCFLFQGTVSTGEEVIPFPVSVEPKDIKVLDLKTVQQIAIKGNPSLDAARERVIQARQQLVQARAAYFPRIDASGGGRRSIMSDNDYMALAATTPGVDDTTDIYTAGISASWTLFDGFQREYSHLRAKHGKNSSIQSRNNVLRLLLYQVAAGYFNAQLARENINIAKANEEFNQRQLHEAEARYRVGTGSLSDVYNFRVRINSAKSQLIAAKQGYEVALYGLASLMGIPDAKLPSPIELSKLEDETGDELKIPDTASSIRYALNYRPDLKQSDYLLQQAKAGVGSARAGYYPTISITGSIDGDRTESWEFENEDFGKSIMLNISFNLFTGGQTMSRVSEAKSRLRESENNLEDTRISVISDVESAVVRLKAAQEQLALQRANTELVQQTRDLVEKEYSAGQGSLVRLNEAQRDLVTAQSNLVLSLVSMRQAWEGLKSSTGEILSGHTE
jgi:TolC family type I secretion outer membrane protein